MQKLLVGTSYLLPEILGQSDRVGAKSPIFDLFSLVASNKYLPVKIVKRQSCKAFIGLTIPAKMIGGDVPLNVNFASSRPKPVVATGAVFSRNVMLYLHRDYCNRIYNY